MQSVASPGQRQPLAQEGSHFARKQVETLQDHDTYVFPSQGHWYGMAEFHTPHYPLQQNVLERQTFICSDICTWPSGIGGILEPYWLNSRGIAIVVRFAEPPLVQISNGIISITANGSEVTLNIYEASRTSALNDFHLEILKMEFGFPESPPNELVFRKPFWSTWALLKKEVDMENIEVFLNRIATEELSIGIFGIDDEWTQNYGDSTFDVEKFGNDPASVLNKLKRKYSVKIVVWFHHFVNENSSNFCSDLVLKQKVKWWNGVDYVYDFTKSEVVNSFRQNLESILHLGVDGFKFDAGESSYAPRDLLERGYSSFLEWKQNYIQIASGFPSKIEETRISASTQRYGLVLRLMDKDSSWGVENGIKSIIPNVLSCAILGYPYIMTDMIGGNAYEGLPDRELYIRWVQLSTLLPIMQFSLPPWTYEDSEVTDITRKMLRLRDNFNDLIMELVQKTTQTGAPIVRPLWWGEKVIRGHGNVRIVDSLFTCCDQFLLGNDIVVAPVLEPSVISRLVLLPSGTWRCALDGMHHVGPAQLRQPVGLGDLVYYERIE